MNQTAAELAQRLVAHVEQSGLLDLALLSHDPEEALKADTSISVRWVDTSSLPPGCSIAATYLNDRTPAEISVALDASAGRRRFSLLHEYAHHLRNQVIEVLHVLFTAVRTGPLEEKMCDAFASLVLVPPHERDRAFADGVTAGAVVDLMTRVSASSQAVAVAAAESMTEPGYVMLLNSAGDAEFAARSGDVYPIARGTRQSGLVLKAASGTPVRGVDRLNRGANYTGELHIDGAVGLDCVVVVAVDGKPPWSSFSGGRSFAARFDERRCGECGATYVVLTSPCSGCGEAKCSECGRCECHEQVLSGSRQCDQCWTLQPPNAFESATATTCTDCS